MSSRGAEPLCRVRIRSVLTGGACLAALALAAAPVVGLAQAPATVRPAPPPAAAQSAPPPSSAAPVSTNRDAKAAAAAAKAKAKAAQDEEDEVSELVVTAGRPQVGAVIGDIKPELQLSPQDVMSYGVSTVTELLDELAPQTRSDRGRGGEAPVVLLNGRRISGFQEIRDIPVEAILRVDILPEEVALKYGYTANQRVVNIVLRRFFRATTVEVTGGAPTEGGEFIGQGEIDEFHVVRDDRLNLDLKVSGHSNLLESDRDVTSIAAGQPFDLLGNVMSPTAGGEIDPALSAQAGRPITVAGVPAVAATRAPTLADFGPTAGVQNSTDVSHDRTLLASNQSVAANAVLSRALPYKFAGTVNGTLEATKSDALQGLSGVALNVPVGDPFSPFGQPVTVDRYLNPNDPLKQTATTWSAHLGGTLNRDISKWRTSLTGAYDHAVSDTDTDVGVDPSPAQALLDARSQTFNPFAPLPTQLLVMQPENKADSTSDTANVQFLANGPTFINVPAGALYASFKLGDSPNWFASQSSRLGVSQSVDLQRNDFTVQGNFDLPIADHAKGVLPIFGKLSANLHLVLDELSDFGALETIGGGLNWTPFTGWNLIVSHTHDEAAPTPQQLGNPIITTTGSRIFDYSTGRTVDVTSISGGTRDLVSDSREVTKIGLTVKPIPTQELTFTANYIVSKITNPIQSFPAATAAIEAAFPDHFLRDGTGQLIQVDNRPVNFASSSRSELRYGLNYSRPFGPQPPPRQFGRRPPGAPQPGSLDPQAEQRRRVTQGDGGAAPANPDGGSPAGGGPPGGGGATGGGGAGGFGGAGGGGFGGGRGGGGGGGGGRGGPGGGGPGGPQGGRLQFAIYHTVFFEDQLLIRPGVPALDLLNGAAAGSTGGQPQHEVEVQAGLTYQGLGARLSADWKSGTVVRGGATSATGDLDFSDIGTINLRFWDDLNQQPNVLKAAPWLRGSRITLNITNLFDERIRVRDANGNTPVSYQPAYLDPTGRVIRLSFRKLFYSIPQRGQRPAGFLRPGAPPDGPPGD